MRSRARDSETNRPEGVCVLAAGYDAPRAQVKVSGRSVQISVQFCCDGGATERVSVTEASRRGVARLVADAAHGDRGGGGAPRRAGGRGGRPTTATPSSTQLRADLRDLALVLGRGADDDGSRARARRRGRRVRPRPARRTRDRARRGTVALTDPALDDLRRAGPVAAALLLGRLAAARAGPDAGTPLVDARTGFRVLDALDGDAARRLRASTRRRGDRARGVGRRRALRRRGLRRGAANGCAPPTRRSRWRSPGRCSASARLTGVRPGAERPAARAGARLAGRRARARRGPDASRRGRDGRGHGVRRVERRPHKVATCSDETDRYLWRAERVRR